MDIKRNPIRGLRGQILSFYLLASTMTIMLIGFILYYSISGVVVSETVESTAMAVEKSGDHLESYIDRIKDLTLMFAEAPATLGYLSGQRPDGGEDVLTMIDTAIGSDAFISSIIIVGKEGQLLSNEASLDMSMSEDMMKENWYVAVVDSDGMPSLTSARMQKFSMDKDHWVISMSREIKDTQGNHLGVIVVDFKYLVVEKFFEGVNLGRQGYLYILNGQGGVVYHDDTSYFENPDKQSELAAMSRMAGGYDEALNLLVHHYGIEGTDWQLVGIASLDGLTAIRRQLVETVLFISLISVIALVAISTYIARRITRPILRLEEVMGEVDHGLTLIDVDRDSSIEVERLAQGYNEMIRRIQTLMADIGEKEKVLKAYELNVLHSQINPHFLYNTLDTIVWMAEFGDSDRVIHITKALARFFRLSLSGGSEWTTLSNELDHVRQYLFIQKERYEDRLNYTVEEVRELAEVKVPKIILQPIVENSIYHGIRHLDRPGHVQVRVEEKGSDLNIIIKDDGVGFDPASAQKEAGNTTKLGGVGMNNVDQRLKLTYGEGYGLEIHSEPKNGTTTIIRISKKSPSQDQEQ